jgi:signal transduction histidine kinase
LDGFDTNWVDGTLPQYAAYADLPPGQYRFRVQASTNAGSWNGTETQWSFNVQPMFYQTPWFRALALLVTVLVGTGAWRLSIHRMRRELGAVFAERLRLSREIHDTLLQNLVGLALDLTSISRRVEPPEVRDQLVSMRRQVEEFVREVRQSIWNLRSPAIDRHGLVEALRAAGEQVTSGKVRFTLTVTGTPRPCSAAIETHVLRIGHEAVMNAVRHARADHVRMALEFEDTVLRLRVADDGCGLAEGLAAQDPQHYGLTTMQERAADVGGRCRIESGLESGVQVTAEFPFVPVR